MLTEKWNWSVSSLFHFLIPILITGWEAPLKERERQRESVCAFCDYLPFSSRSFLLLKPSSLDGASAFISNKDEVELLSWVRCTCLFISRGALQSLSRISQRRWWWWARCWDASPQRDWLGCPPFHLHQTVTEKAAKHLDKWESDLKCEKYPELGEKHFLSWMGLFMFLWHIATSLTNKMIKK